ncbi:MAG: hypothetical protein RH946_21775 [Rhodospirillales bacterium]
MDSFLDLIQVAVDRIGEVMIIVHAEVGPVAWLWDEGLDQFCLGYLAPGT